MDFQQLASEVPKYYSNHPIYQSVWVGGKEIVHGTRDNMFPRMEKIRLEDIKGKYVVDIGCNLGAASFWALDNGAKATVGYDVAEAGIELANLIAHEHKLPATFYVGDFGVPHKKYGDVAFCFACVDDITKENDDKRMILRDNLLKYDVVYFETHLKHTFPNWNLPDIIKDAFDCEYLGETGENNLKRDFYRMTCQSS